MDDLLNIHRISGQKNPKNPQKNRPKGLQRRFSLNVWLVIMDDSLIDPYFWPRNFYAACRRASGARTQYVVCISTLAVPHITVVKFYRSSPNFEDLSQQIINVAE